MTRHNNQLWVGGAVFLCIVILLGTYFLAAKPRLESASEMDEERSQVEVTNTKLKREVSLLREQEATLPEVRQSIAALQVGIPVEAKLDEFALYVGQLADENAVIVSSFTVLPPTLVIVEAPAPEATPEPAPTASEAPVAGEAGTAAADETLLQDTLGGMSMIGLSVTVVGTTDNTQAFFNALQTVSTRHVMLNGAAIDAVLVDTPAAAGLPDLLAGEVVVTISGSLYVLPGIAQPEDPAAVAPEPRPLPVPAPGMNPFAPFLGAAG